MSFPADDPTLGDNHYVPSHPPEPPRGDKLVGGLLKLLVITGIGMAVISSCMDKYSREHPKNEVKVKDKSSGLENRSYAPREFPR